MGATSISNLRPEVATNYTRTGRHLLLARFEVALVQPRFAALSFLSLSSQPHVVASNQARRSSSASA